MKMNQSMEEKNEKNIKELEKTRKNAKEDLFKNVAYKLETHA